MKLKIINFKKEFNEIWEKYIKNETIKACYYEKPNSFNSEMNFDEDKEGYMTVYSNNYKMLFTGMSCNGMSVTMISIYSPKDELLCHEEQTEGYY